MRTVKAIYFKSICLWIYVCSCTTPHGRAMQTPEGNTGDTPKEECTMDIDKLLSPISDPLNFDDIENKEQAMLDDALKLETITGNNAIVSLNEDFYDLLSEDKSILNSKVQSHDSNIGQLSKNKQMFDILGMNKVKSNFKANQNMDELFKGIKGFNTQSSELSNDVLMAIQKKKKDVDSHHSARQNKIIQHRKSMSVEIMEQNATKMQITQISYNGKIKMKNERIDHEKKKLSYHIQEIKGKIEISEQLAVSKQKKRIAKSNADNNDIVNKQKQNIAKSGSKTAQELNQMRIDDQYAVNEQKENGRRQNSIVKSLESTKRIKSTDVTCKSVLRGTGKIYINLRMICYSSRSKFRVEVYFMDSSGKELYNWITPVNLLLTRLEDKTRDWAIHVEKSLIPKISKIGIKYAWPTV